MPLSAYQAARTRVESPRSAEHRLLGEITGEMMTAQAVGATGAQLMPALHRNREMWSVFASDCGAKGNGLPADLRAQIISLSLWVDRFTSDVMAGRETIAELIALNRIIMDGLRSERRAA